MTHKHTIVDDWESAAVTLETSFQKSMNAFEVRNQLCICGTTAPLTSAD